MKESLMEKLIELLSKAKPLAPGFWWDIRNDGAMIISKEEKNNGHSGEICFVKKEELCGKEYGFIKWLLENDKIDRDKILKENGQFRVFFYDLERVKNYDRLVMYLSVEDNPIEFLISILK